MKRIAVIDDRAEDRKLVAEALDDAIEAEGLSEAWEVVEVDPLPEAIQYAAWLNENSIDILIIDERLFEASTGILEPGYLGSTAVEQIRQTHKRLPILGISADTNTKEFNEKFGLFDDIIVRENLTEEPRSYLKRFIRKAESMLEENANELAELSLLSEAIATGGATDEQVQRALAIQEALAIPLSAASLATRQGWIEEYTKKVEKLEHIQHEMEALIEKTEPSE
jgi:CheY-like chemotaxis protein